MTMARRATETVEQYKFTQNVTFSLVCVVGASSKCLYLPTDRTNIVLAYLDFRN